MLLFICIYLTTLFYDETMWKEWLCLDLKCYSDRRDKEIREATKDLRNKLSLGWDFNPGPPDFEAGLLPTDLQSSVNYDKFYVPSSILLDSFVLRS